MAEHNLFMGGNRVAFRYPQSMFPQTDVLEDQEFEADNRRGPIRFSITRRFAWRDPNEITRGANADGSQGLADYLANNTIATGDIINSHIMPRFASLDKIWWMVKTPSAAGVSVSVQLRGNAASVGGVQVLIPSIPLDAIASDLFVLPAPIYFDQNDMLQLVITGPGNLNEALKCSNFLISPVVEEYCRGFS